MSHREEARELVARMTLEEKASLTSGLDFWYLKSIERLGLASIMVTDGPHGLRKQPGLGGPLGITENVPAVCFPTSATLACSFDRNLMRRIGVALGEECRQEDVAVILGPGLNIKRSPLCGRNFEYYSEDPFLTGEMATALVQGIQSQDVGVSVKHYAFNNQETRRLTTDSVVDERAAREIYLSAFEEVVKNAQPWTLMCSYNLFEGIYCSENKRLLTDILRTEWGFEGLVMSDWGAVNERIKGITAGLDLQMPADGGINDAKLVAAVKNGTLSERDLDAAAVNVTELILKASKREPLRYDVYAHRTLAAMAAAASTVLLKNEGGLLPMPKNTQFALIGAFGKRPRYQGAGSSKIEPVKLESVYDCLKAAGVTFAYADGYQLTSDIPDERLIAEAVVVAKEAEYVFVIAGLPDAYESEGFDRTSMKMPEAHNKLIEQLTAVNKNVIVVLLGGAPMEITWHEQASGIMMCYLGGEAGGSAIANLILGTAIPDGRLAESWPYTAEDNPSALYFPGFQKTVEYRESIFVGYRYYDTAGKTLRYPFGFGLSYTNFEYGEIRLDKNSINDTELLTFTIDITNVGSVSGSEVVQLYVAHKNSAIFKATQELKGFEKLFLAPGERGTISFVLDKRAFAYYNVARADWHVESGDYELRVGASSRDIRQTAVITITSTLETTMSIVKGAASASVPNYRETATGYYNLKSAAGITQVSDDEFAALLGRPLPPRQRDKNEPFDQNSTFGEIRSHWFGRIFVSIAKKQASKTLSEMSDDVQTMFESMFYDMPLRNMMMLGSDQVAPGLLDGLVTALNGHFFKGVLRMLK